MNRNIEQFKQEMCQVIQDIDTLVFVLEGGASLVQEDVSCALNRYSSIVDRIANAFDNLNKTEGSTIICYSSSASPNFVEQCVHEQKI